MRWVVGDFPFALLRLSMEPSTSECGITVFRLVWGQDIAGSIPAIQTIYDICGGMARHKAMSKSFMV